MKDSELFSIAREVLDRAYAPFSGFKVGAALLTKEGKVFTGVNVENSSYGASICAERVACVKAISEGYQEFKAIAIVSSEGEVMPCGICRQFLFEFNEELRIISGNNEKDLRVYTLKELLPEGFNINTKAEKQNVK